MAILKQKVLQYKLTKPYLNKNRVKKIVKPRTKEMYNWTIYWTAILVKNPLQLSWRIKWKHINKWELDMNV